MLTVSDPPFGIKVAHAAEATIDSTTSTTSNNHKNQPALVFVNDSVGYIFYKDIASSTTCGYSKTTNSGANWGAFVSITGQTTCLGISVWYDRWTPGDTNGTFIHIVFFESNTDDVFYERLNTSDDTQLGEIAVDKTAGSLSNADNIAITKSTNGAVYIGLDDGNTAGKSKVRMCRTNCNVGASWSNAGVSPLQAAYDPMRLLPLAGDNILLIRDDISLNDIQSKVYTNSTDTWDAGWTTFDANAAESGTYLETIAATVDRFTNDIYLAYGASVAVASAADIRTAVYSNGVWSLKTDVILNGNTVTNLDIAIDENTNDVYVAYLRGTLTTSMNAYYKKSNNGMSSWSAETKFNTVNTDLRWMYLNRMSNERIYGAYEQNTGGNDGLFGNTIVDLIDSPPIVRSNINNIIIGNNTLLSLNATIYDSSGVANATVNVSSVNSTLNQVILTQGSGYFWLNTSIVADRGETNGFMNLNIKAYDNMGNLNNSINMTVWIDATPPSKVENFTNITVPSHSGVDVSWNASIDNGSGIKEYQIEQTNESFNYLTVPRDVINAQNVSTGYEQDAYWFTFKTNSPVNCETCHGFQRPWTGNFFAKYNESYLYILMHTPDNDSSQTDESVRLAFDINMNGGTFPQSDDRMYQINEDNNLTYYVGNGSGWVINSSNATSAVRSAGTNGPRLEIRIPLPEIGSPLNNTSINFMFSTECTNASDFIEKHSYFPSGADEDNPGTWKTITFRNYTDYKFVSNTSSLLDLLRNLFGSYRYNFSVKAIDNVGLIGLRSDPLIIQTVENPAYNISGYLKNTLNRGLTGLVSIHNYKVATDSSGFYTLEDMGNGSYTVNGSASGYSGNSTIITVNGSDQSNVNITLQDVTPPSVVSNTNNEVIMSNTVIILNATITDAELGIKNATVNVTAINSTIKEAILTLQGGFWINSSIIADRGETDGIVGLQITAYDNGSIENKGVNMTVGIDNTAPVVVSNTNNLYVSNGKFITLNASIIDAFSGEKNATVNVSQVNSTINEAILTLWGDEWINNTIIADRGETTDFKNLTITAYDNAGNVNTSINMTVKINPKLTITDWSNNITNDQSLNFAVFINDSVRFNVTSNHTASYNWTYDSIDQLQDFDNFSNIFSQIGSHYFNMTISNLIDNDYKNWTINVVYKPDLVMTPENISYSYESSEVENSDVKENVNVTINVTVYNGGLGDASNINIGFYDGSPGTGNNFVNSTIINISAGESKNATVYWNSILGTHNISIKTDPENTLVETDNSNNNASKNINVSAWLKYYGNVSGNLSLSDSIGNSMTNWYWATPQGNIFISNNSLIDYSNLQALGRKKNGNVSLNNFGRADELLNMTPGSRNATGFFNNNITMLFSSNGTTPRNYTNFTVYGRTIEHVAVFNSTDTANFNSVENSTFITGILWDTSKDNGDGDYGDDGEEIVFISGIQVNNTGLGNSRHDYEIAVPSIIRSEGNVYCFVELK